MRQRERAITSELEAAALSASTAQREEARLRGQLAELQESSDLRFQELEKQLEELRQELSDAEPLQRVESAGSAVSFARLESGDAEAKKMLTMRCARASSGPCIYVVSVSSCCFIQSAVRFLESMVIGPY